MLNRALPILCAEGLGHRFPDGVWAFRGIDFDIKCGEVSVLAGRNGAGKSCFAKHLAGLMEPTEGAVRISGHDLKSIKDSPARHVGYLFQDARLQVVGERVLDDVLFGPTNVGVDKGAALSRARQALSDCGLAEKEEAFVHRLSGGEIRRLAIAGLLAMKPEAMILDEPFANLDFEGVGGVLRIVGSMAKEGIAVLIVTHEVEKILGMADVFSVMEHGSIVLRGGPREVLSKGIERFGLRDPFRPISQIMDLSWLA